MYSLCNHVILEPWIISGPNFECQPKRKTFCSAEAKQNSSTRCCFLVVQNMISSRSELKVATELNLKGFCSWFKELICTEEIYCIYSTLYASLFFNQPQKQLVVHSHEAPVGWDLCMFENAGSRSQFSSNCGRDKGCTALASRLALKSEPNAPWESK